MMKLLVIFVIIQLTSCDLIFPMKFEDLDKECRDSSRSSGVYKLEKNCTTEKVIVGYIESVGPIVCCIPIRIPKKIPAINEIKLVTKKSGDRARKYCEA